MATLVRTNITLPEDVLAMVDEVAGPRGRSRYLAEVIERQVRRDRARRIIEDTAGAAAHSTGWGVTDEEVTRNLRELRASWDRDVDDPEEAG